MTVRHSLIAAAALGFSIVSSPAWGQQSAPAANAAPVPSRPATLPSMLQESPQPPRIRIDSGNLTIEATNSSLRAILDDLGRRTGTRIDGLAHDERIFGVYGPGNPQQVLASLLDDSGYNVLISGKNPDGAPREIVLSARAAAPAAASTQPGGLTQAAQEDDDADGADTPPAQPALFVPPPQSPQQAPAANSPQQVKTPAQMLQELQQLRQAQQQQQTPPQ